MLYILSLSIVLIMGFALSTNSYAQDDIWARARYHDEKLEELYRDVKEIKTKDDLEFRLTNAMAKEILGEEKYYKLVLEIKDEKRNTD